MLYSGGYFCGCMNVIKTIHKLSDFTVLCVLLYLAILYESGTIYGG